MVKFSRSTGPMGSYNPGKRGIIDVRHLSICCCACLALASRLAAASFEQKVLPVLEANCTPCHNEQTHTSGFSIVTLKSFVAGGARHGAAVKPGRPEESVVVQMLKGDIKPQMPFGKKLADADLSTIVNWIRDEGSEISAELPKQTKYWAFIRPAKPVPPPVSNAGWQRNPI